MVIITKEDWDYINSNRGSYSARGMLDVLTTVENNFDSKAREKLIEEMSILGIDISNIRETSIVPLTTFITLLVVIKQVLDLDEKEMLKLGGDAAKLSFVLKYASRLLLSLDIICKNANVGWYKYYKTGELIVTELNKEKGKVVGEVRNFTGHPLHCRFMEGHFSQMIFFITGKAVDSYEEECVFKGGKVHRYVMNFL